MAETPNRYPFFEKLVVDNPRGALRYAGHMAEILTERSTPGSVREQLIDARISGDSSALEIAEQRNQQLRAKFMELMTCFHAEHVIIGNMASHGDARYIFDVLVEERGPL